MSNFKEINWDKIRADYVMGVDYPSYDELSKRYNVSKPLIIAKANDTEDAINRGKTWMQQRDDFIQKKQSVQQDAAVQEAKAAVKTFIKVLNNVGLKAFKVIDRELDYLSKMQDDAINNKEHFPIKKFVRISDIAKIAEVLHKLSGAESSREMLIKLQVAQDVAGKKNINLQDLTDEEFEQIDQQVKRGGVPLIVDQSGEDGSD